MNFAQPRPTAKVLKLEIDATNMEDVLGRVTRALETSSNRYICVAGVHGVMEAQRSPTVAAVYAGALMTIPDGMPLVWVGALQGHRQMQRVTGPDFMFEILRRKEFAAVTHFFYGGEEGVAEQLRHRFNKQFPWVKIVGTCTPPFRELSPIEERELAGRIGILKPDIIWVGIGCPKQELFMSRFTPMLETKLMIGVGAAFDFHTGRIRDCRHWIKSAGLQWLHRLVQDPKRLWRRYLRNNPAFLFHIALQLICVRVYSRPASNDLVNEHVHPNSLDDVGEYAISDSLRKLTRT